MVDYSAPLYQHPSEVWDSAKCKRMANRTIKDGLGTPYPFKGYIGSHYGDHHNGGTIIGGVWYQGETRPLPIVSEGFELVRVPTWGWRIVVTNSTKAHT